MTSLAIVELYVFILAAVVGYQVITRVGDRPVGTCVPWVHCDPVACTLPPVAPR